MAEKTEFKTVETSQEDLEELEEKIAEVLQEQSKDFEDLIESADKKGIDLEAVSYTHLTLPTNSRV